jgi:hypothetical protein
MYRYMCVQPTERINQLWSLKRTVDRTSDRTSGVFNRGVFSRYAGYSFFAENSISNAMINENADFCSSVFASSFSLAFVGGAFHAKPTEMPSMGSRI